jgi:hypothetical protein
MESDLERLQKETDTPPPEQTEGVKLARRNRAACDDLSEEERDALVEEAMKAIYGGQTSTARA